MKSLTAKQKNLMWIWTFLLPCILVFLLFYLVPVLTLVYTSFTKWDGANLPVFTGLTNYIKLFGAEDFQRALVNLLLWSLIAGTLHVFFGTLIALILFKEPHGWKFVETVFMIPNVIAMAAWAMIYRFVFNGSYGVLNGIIRLFVPRFAVDWLFQSPYAFFAVTLTWVFYAVVVTLLVLGDLKAIPSDLHEAARIDGANEWYITMRINLPLCRNSIGTAVICSISARISMYETIALTTRGGPGNDTMNIPLILVNAINNSKYGYANAAGMVMLLIGIILLVVVNKAFRMNDSVY